MRAEGGLQTVCIREEREYLSLSSWMRERRRSEGEERREMSKVSEADGGRGEHNDRLIQPCPVNNNMLVFIISWP